MDFSKALQNKYFPKRTPSEYSQGFIQDELGNISTAIEQQALGFIDVSHVEPTKPRQGMIRYASGGAGWNPGGGEGIYYFNSAGSWIKL